MIVLDVIDPEIKILLLLSSIENYPTFTII